MSSKYFNNEQLAQAHSEMLFPEPVTKHRPRGLSAVVVVICIVSAVAGAGITIVLRHMSQNLGRWVEVVPEKTFIARVHSGVEVDPEILNLKIAGHDVMLPELTQFKAHAKFLESGAGQYRLGYLVSTRVDDVASGVFPSQFSDAAVVYGVILRFTLRDEDGFTLASLQSPEQKFFTGREAKFQDFATKEVPEAIASKVREIEVGVQVAKVGVVNCCSLGPN